MSWVALTKVVVRGVPLKLTTAPLTKFVPVTAKVKAAEPATAVDGARVVAVGMGGAVMVKGSAFEVPPPEGLVTVIGTVPTLATSVAGMAAVTCVAVTKVVALAAPLKLTTAPLPKFEPLTTKVNAAEPAIALEGTRLVSRG